MPQVPFVDEQKAQLVGWLNREKDYLLSVASMAEKIQIPRATESLELVRNDLEFAVRVRTAVRAAEEGRPVELNDNDAETLVDVARANNYPNREEFWRGVIAAIESTLR